MDKRHRDYLSNAGFLDWEIKEIMSAHYRSFRRDPSLGKNDPAIYLQRAIRSRRLYVWNLINRYGYTQDQVKRAIERLYKRKGWLTHPKGLVVEGVRRDPMAMIREYRKKTIEEGSYRRPPKKGSHHKLITKQDILEQGKRRMRISPLEKYAMGRGKE